MNLKRIFGILWRGLLVVFGIYMSIMTVRAYTLVVQDFADFEKYSKMAEGQVIEVIQKPMSGDGGRYTSDHRVRFHTPDGKEVIFTDHTAVDLGLVLGQIVPVKYMPDDPEYARVEAEGQDLNSSLALWVLRVLILAFAFVAFYFARSLFRYLNQPSPSSTR